MSSTEDDAGDELARGLFTELVLPLAERRRHSARHFFPLGPDSSLPSYYTAPLRTTMACRDFELPGESPHEFVRRLIEFWKDEGNDDLASLAAGLETLAMQLAGEMNPQEEDISPFMYTMF